MKIIVKKDEVKSMSKVIQEGLQMIQCLNCGRISSHRFCTGECKRVYLKTHGICISPDGDDTTGEGSDENPYQTVERAVESAGNNDYVVYQKGMQIWF